MGSFANSIFSVMLGWVRSAVNWVWQLAASQEGSGAIEWLGQNWLMLTLILCGAGMVIDLIVHTLRWRPYKVWASFFRRIFGREEETGNAPAPAPVRRPRPQRPRVQREWLYADGTAYPEHAAPADTVPADDARPGAEASSGHVNSADMSRQYVMKFARPEQRDVQLSRLRYQEELNRELPVTGLEDYPQPKPAPADQPPPEPVSQTGRQSRRVTRVTARHFFESNEDEIDLRYRPAPPAVDKREAYGQPYYPPQWRMPADVGASTERKDESSGTNSAV